MNLIIQGLEVQNHDLRELAKLAGANHIERITGQAFRLENAGRRENVAEYCADADLDFAFFRGANGAACQFWPDGHGYGFDAARYRIH